MRNSLGPALFSLLGACASSPTATPPPDTGPASDAGPESPPALAWEPCTLRSEGDGPPAECTTMSVPLRHTDANGEQISFFVKRFRPGKGTRALWLLQGGPGGSGYAFEKIVEQLSVAMPDVDYYIPDHRGTGRSTRLGCPEQEKKGSKSGIFIAAEEWPACLAAVRAEWGDKLTAFRTTEAANDLGLAIERARAPGQPVFVMGVSYGTYWAHRYLQMFPKQPAGVIVDSIFPPGGSLARQDQDADEAGALLFAACAKDPLCSSKLGADPRARTLALYDKLEKGHCPALGFEGITQRAQLRIVFGQMMMSFGMRTFIPPLVYRAERCTPADADAVNKALGLYLLPKPPTPFLTQWGWILSNNITFSELWEDPSPTADALQEIREKAAVSRDVTSGMSPNLGAWPVYGADEYTGKWATVDRPTLALAGGLDPATLLRKALPWKDHFKGPNQHWVEIATASHTVIASSPMTDLTRSCGSRILKGFVENPRGPLDTSCLSDLAPLTFAGRPDLTKSVLGTDDPWE